MEFELRSAIRNSFNEIPATQTEPTKIIFNMTIVVGIKGNNYPAFLNSENSINVECLKSMTGEEMDSKIKQDCATFVQENFQPII